jgi:hypothetical protein
VTTIHEALLAVRQQVGAVGKGSYNDFHKFRFRGVEEVLNAVGPALLANRVNFYPRLLNLDSRDITTEKNKRNREVTVTVEYRYVGPEGDEVTVVVPGESADAGSSAVSKAMSVALRIAHIQALQIPTAMTDPEAGALDRADDPVRAVKRLIGVEARKLGWIKEDDSYEALSLDFHEWSRGENDVDTADLDTLKEYLAKLRPHVTMQRKPAGGGR